MLFSLVPVLQAFKATFAKFLKVFYCTSDEVCSDNLNFMKAKSLSNTRTTTLNILMIFLSTT